MVRGGGAAGGAGCAGRVREWIRSEERSRTSPAATLTDRNPPHPGPFSSPHSLLDSLSLHSLPPSLASPPLSARARSRSLL